MPSQIVARLAPARELLRRRCIPYAQELMHSVPKPGKARPRPPFRDSRQASRSSGISRPASFVSRALPRGQAGMLAKNSGTG